MSTRPDSPAVTGSAKAVTKNDEVHFRPGAYQPGTTEGDWLIAHELAHVVQQRRDRGDRIGTRKELEREADRAATLVAFGRVAPIRLRADRAMAYAFDEAEPHDRDLDDAVVETDREEASRKDGRGVAELDAAAKADTAHRADGDDAAEGHEAEGPAVHDRQARGESAARASAEGEPAPRQEAVSPARAWTVRDLAFALSPEQVRAARQRG